MIKAIIIDDESKARDLLKFLIRQSPHEIEVVGDYETLPKGIEGIKEHQPNVVFLDIEMPLVSGIKILEYIPNPDFEIIFATAYDSYAIQAFELSALDYLLKPINKEKLFKSIEKVGQQMDVKARLQLYEQNNSKDNSLKICIPSLEENYYIEVENILAIEANRSYCFIHTANKKYVLSRPLSTFEQKYMPLEGFERVHRSWIANMAKAKGYIGKTKEIILDNDTTIPVSRRYMDKVKELIVSLSILLSICSQLIFS
ncbi:MAG: response regulator transcription factor [Aureispira sp.]|nr:response regulator transcription factor [Aureispira sp.]